MSMREPVLCYVDEPWAFFTTQPLDQQWGDDWNDTPYEHNAGNPYQWHPGAKNQRWEIVRIAFIAPLETPSSWVRNSSYSVDNINERKAPWLQTDRYARSGVPTVQIWAGEPIAEVIEKIRSIGGTVWLPEARMQEES